MPELNLTNAPTEMDSFDGIVVMKAIDDITGGKVLDTTGFPDDIIVEGQGVILETATGKYKPLPITGVITAGHTAVGVVRASVSASKPAVGIVIRGKVNEAAAKYPYSTAFKAALPLITFTED